MSNRSNKEEQTEEIEKEFDSSYSEFSKKTIDEINKNLDDPKLRSFIVGLFETGEYAAIMEVLIQKNIVKAVELGYGGFIGTPDAETIGKKIYTRSWVEDGITASKRIQRATNRVKRAVANDITTIIREGDSIKKIIKNVRDRVRKGEIDSDPIRKSIARLSRSTRDEKTLKEVKKLRRELTRGNLTRTKKAYLKFLDAFEEQDKKKIARTINKAIDEKARYVAERISRTEVGRAWTEGFHLKHKNDDDVVGYKWKLSNGHQEVYDQCDVYANTNFGMGKGVFPKGRIPQQPAHPNCRCYLIPVYKGDADPRDFKLKNGIGQIKRLPEKQKSLLMGEKNRKDFNNGKISYMKAVRGFEKPKEIKTRIVENDIK